MLPKYEHFKFSVGQFVQSSYMSMADKQNKTASEMLREAFQIVERTYQECPGGVQLHYLCRGRGMWGNGRELVRFNEIELAEIVQPEEV